MRFSDLRIGMKLILGFSILLLILAATVVSSNILNSRNKHILLNALTLSNTKTVLLESMKGALLEESIAIRNIGLASDVSRMQKEESRSKKERARFMEAYAELVKLGLTKKEAEILNDIERIEKNIQRPRDEAIGQALAFDNESSAKIISSQIDPLNLKALAEMENLVELQRAAAKDILERSVVEDEKLKFLLIALACVAMVVGLGIAWLTTRSIVTPLKGAVAFANQVAVGDLRSTITKAHKDEIGQMLDALAVMSGSLSSMVADVRCNTEALEVSVKEIVHGNIDLSTRTESQAGSLEQTAAAMEILTDTVRKNAENARQANHLITSTSNFAIEGGQVVERVVEKMSAIKESAVKIANISGVIDALAFQTNLLALNAAVEAARAGEQGRGFAVVAAEVRALAHRSASAAREIRELISESEKGVDVGEEMATEAGESMKKIVSSIKHVADIMSEIAIASSEQSDDITEIGKAISRMDEMTQQNAALVEESYAAAESMQGRSYALAKAVSAFKILPQENYIAAAGRIIPEEKLSIVRTHADTSLLESDYRSTLTS